MKGLEPEPEPGVAKGFSSAQWPPSPYGGSGMSQLLKQKPQGCVQAGFVPCKSVLTPHPHLQHRRLILRKEQHWSKWLKPALGWGRGQTLTVPATVSLPAFPGTASSPQVTVMGWTASTPSHVLFWVGSDPVLHSLTLCLSTTALTLVSSCTEEQERALEVGRPQSGFQTTSDAVNPYASAMAAQTPLLQEPPSSSIFPSKNAGPNLPLLFPSSPVSRGSFLQP